MTITTNRRTALAAGLALTLSRFELARAEESSRGEYNPTLSWLPALPEDPSLDPTSIVSHADMARYWEVKGVEPPRSFNDETARQWIEIGQLLPVNEGVMLQTMAQSWDEVVGFSFWDADQVTVANDPPNQVRIYQGSFDPGRIVDRLSEAGYEHGAEGDFALLSHPTGKLDLTTELGQLAIGNFNHLATSRSLVIASRSREEWEAALAAGMGEAPSLAEQPSFSEIAAVIAPMTGYLIVNGDVLGAGGPLNQEPIDGPTLPPARMLIAGITVEERGQTVSLIADLEDPQAAESAVDVIEDRLANITSPVTLVPYAENLEGYEVGVVPNTGMVRVTVTNDVFAMRWMRYVFAGDLLFLGTE